MKKKDMPKEKQSGVFCVECMQKMEVERSPDGLVKIVRCPKHGIIFQRKR